LGGRRPTLWWVLVIHPRFGTLGLYLALLLAAYALVGEPILGRRWYARLGREREHDGGALLRFYRLTLSIEWSWTALVAIVIVVAPGLTPAAIGIQLPGGRYLPETLALTGYLVVIIAASTVVLRRRSAAGKSVPGQSAVAAMLPRTPAERRLALAVSLSAGLCEEALYRGLLIALVVDIFGLSVVAAAVVAVGVFAVAHSYQGLKGVLGTGLLGALLAAGYVATGSLLLPIIIHVLVDLRGLVLVPAVDQHISDREA